MTGEKNSNTSSLLKCREHELASIYAIIDLRKVCLVIVLYMHTDSMRSALVWIFTLNVCLHILFIPGGDSKPHPRFREKITEDYNRGFISIDCGASNDYLDEETSIFFKTDTDFIETGENLLTSSAFIDTNIPSFGRQLHTLRSFPEGNRNCYTLKPEYKQGEQQSYLIRALFGYGNYDGKNHAPKFDLYLGVNYWKHINTANYSYDWTEIIHAPTTDTIQVCLVNIDTGTPFISSLELRPLSTSIYQIMSQSYLFLWERYDLGGPVDNFSRRYKDDIYDRMWYSREDWYKINTTIDVNKSGNDIYKVPAEVLKTAVQSFNRSYDLYYDLEIDWNVLLDKYSRYYVYFHFAEIQKLAPGLRRIINITLNDENILSEPITLEYMKPVTISNKNATQGFVRFSIRATAESDAPPILNAFEVYKLVTDLNSPTDIKDVDAIVNIKRYYGISRIDWQGDPCVPEIFRWSGLDCSYGINPRIISLNLSSSKLGGQIAASVSDLSELQSLDVSDNSLNGFVPESLSQLEYLRILNIGGNKLSGSIPAKLIERSKNGSLILSVDGNQNLCTSTPCHKRNRVVIPLVATLAGAFILLAVSLFVFRRVQVVVSMKKLKFSNKMEYVDSKKQEFSYSEVQMITNNFERVVGKGGFGTVYYGCIGETRVAVKMLSHSTQGVRQFQTEANILTRVHHRCLTPLIGYCNEGTRTALIYEYMTNGDLAEKLSGQSQTFLGWEQRFQIALDSAIGLEYLHYGCKPPIIHRDVKTRNILLDKNLRAKISDFGLSRIFSDDGDTHVSTAIAGTPGYLDPEYNITNRLNEKSDVYSFGIVLLEIITGRTVILKTQVRTHIIKWVSSMLADDGEIDGVVDTRLQGEYDSEAARKVIDVAMACVAPSSVNRPTMNQVVMELKQCFPMGKLGTTSTGSSEIFSAGEISGLSSLARYFYTDKGNGYTEKTTSIFYISDAKFIDAGVSKSISPAEKSTHLQQLAYVRSFPSGERNCYRINVTSGTKYLIRATFFYGNYDGLNQPPQFDLHLGPNLWDTVSFPNASLSEISEIIYTPSLDYIHPCLVNKGQGAPFISTIELRTLKNASYVTASAESLAYYRRYDLGSITNLVYRYNYDVYDRIWVPHGFNQWTQLSSTLNLDIFQNDYKLPEVVMSTAATPINASAPFQFYWDPDNVNEKFYIYMHFNEVKILAENETRTFNIFMNGKLFYGPLTPGYLTTNIIYSTSALTGATRYLFSLAKTGTSTLPPIMNAMEIYKVIDFAQSETEQDDVDAITNIKNAYGVDRNWQGDPCGPVAYIWEGLNCSYDNTPRITSLDLSNNSLSGSVPDFLTQLQSLKVLNLAKNNLTGPVPGGLVERSKQGSLSLSLDQNPNLCESDPCIQQTNNKQPDGDQQKNKSNIVILGCLQ
ncbi:putative leucine-rich repeat receptor-like protein kinase [Glycine soja]